MADFRPRPPGSATCGRHIPGPQIARRAIIPRIACDRMAGDYRNASRPFHPSL